MVIFLGGAMLDFQCNVKIVNQMMGCGKTSAAINYINESDEDEKFFIITPYLDEVDRYKLSCKSKSFKQPTWEKGTKIESLKDLINKNSNIVSTHALFQKFDLELIDMCRARNYTLIMDEVANVVEEYPISDSDYKILEKDFIYVDEDTNQIKWREDRQDYSGEFSDIKRLCNLGSLAYYSGSVMMWLFPIDVFNSFRSIYIMTYMFEAQMQRYYYDYYRLQYEYYHVEGNSLDNFRFYKGVAPDHYKYNYSDLVHILDNEKMNLIGDRSTDLSKTWFERNKKNVAMKQLQNNLTNFFRNIRNNKSNDNLWTTFKDYKKSIQGKGYTKGFLALNMRATNEYRNRTSVAYIANRYMHPIVKNFFVKHNIDVDEDMYATSEMLQFIWRSAIRDGKEIWIYIPSIRMRNLLQKWLDSSKTGTYTCHTITNNNVEVPENVL